MTALSWQLPRRLMDSPPDAAPILVGPEVVRAIDVCAALAAESCTRPISVHRSFQRGSSSAIDCQVAIEDPRCGHGPADPPTRREPVAGLPAPAGGVVAGARAPNAVVSGRTAEADWWCCRFRPETARSRRFVGHRLGRDRSSWSTRPVCGCRDVRPIVFGIGRITFFLTIRPRARTCAIRSVVHTTGAWHRASFSSASE